MSHTEGRFPNQNYIVNVNEGKRHYIHGDRPLFLTGVRSFILSSFMLRFH